MDEERKFNLSVDIKEKKKSGTVLMTEGSIWKKLLIFSVPLILGNLLQQLYSTVDSIIVGNCVGKEALAAVGSTGSIVSLLIAFSQGASVGAGVIISQYMGAKRKDDVKRAVHTAMAIAVIIGLVLTVMGVFMSRLFLVWMQTPDNILDGASLYLQIYCGGLLFDLVKDYQYIFAWDFLFTVLSFLCFVKLYRDWQKRGGRHGYVAPVMADRIHRRKFPESL